MTDTSDQSGEVSQLTGSSPTARSAAFTTPASLLSIHDQADEDTISGSSHGTRNRARRVGESRKFWWKNTARASPMVNWKASDAAVKMAVWPSAGRNVGSSMTSR